MNTAELARRLDNLVRYGVIEQTDFTTDPIQPRVRVRTGEILTTWLPIATSRAHADAEHDPVQIGEHVILVAPSGELTQAVVVGKLFSSDHPSPDNNPANHRRKYRDGAVIEYNSEAHHLNATLPAGGTLNLKADGGITIIGDITHIGDLNQTGKQNVSGDVMAGGISQINHLHEGVSSGPSKTSKPV
jgi:phage baseplate assembly protein V